MTDEVRLEINRKVIKGIHAMSFIECNPQLWVLEVFDSFGSHIYGICALEIREAAK